MSFCNKTGTTYSANSEVPIGLLPTKNGYEQFVLKPIEHDLSWIAVNNKVISKGETK